MATQNLTRKNRFNEKRKVAVFTAELDYENLLNTSGDIYQLFQLPKNSLVTHASAIVQTAFDSATSASLDLGFAGDDTLIDGADLTSAAGTELSGGTNVVVPAIKQTGGIVTAVPTYTGATTTGKILVRIEYIEYNKVTGELTEYVD